MKKDIYKPIILKPISIDECMKALQEVLSPEEQIELTRMSKDKLICYHHGLGQWIRNNWDLWKCGELFDHMTSLGFNHPDDMSMSIIKEFWCRMNQQPSELEKDIKEYKEFYDKQGKNESS